MFGVKKSILFAEFLSFTDAVSIPVGDTALWQTLRNTVCDSRMPAPTPSYEEPIHLSMHLAFDLWEAWRRVHPHGLGYPTALTHPITHRDGSAEVHLPTWPTGLSNDASTRFARIGQFDVGPEPPIRLRYVYAAVTPVSLCDSVTYDLGFRVLNRPNWHSEWECSLAIGLAALDLGVSPEDLDFIFFGRSDRWRKFYRREGERVYRTDAHTLPSLDDEYWRA